MPTINVDVEVELDEISANELIQELLYRIKHKRLTDAHKTKLKGIGELTSSFVIPEGLCVESLDDKMKLEHLTKVWPKYNWARMSEALPE